MRHSVASRGQKTGRPSHRAGQLVSLGRDLTHEVGPAIDELAVPGLERDEVPEALAVILAGAVPVEQALDRLGAKDAAVEITRISRITSHNPRSSKNRASSEGLLRRAIRPALVPARNTKVGAQKWVIQRVANNSGPVPGSVIGSCIEPAIT